MQPRESWAQNTQSTDDLRFKQLADKKKRSRRRKVTYFHPPFCNSVKTKIGKIFRNLVSKHFSRDHRYYKIFNKNTIKISYSCLPNVKAVINTHNRKVLNNDKKSKADDGKMCNCRKKDDCPLDGKCLTSNLIYSAKVTTTPSNSPKVYIGSTRNTFKQKYYGHKTSFNKEKLRGSTQLARYICKLKKAKQDYNIKWTIIKQSYQNTPSIKFCKLCNLERIEIAKNKKAALLNSRNELVTKCPHNRKL